MIKNFSSNCSIIAISVLTFIQIPAADALDELILKSFSKYQLS